MKENEHVAEIWDWTRDIQIFTELFRVFVFSFHAEIALVTENANTKKKW